MSSIVRLTYANGTRSFIGLSLDMNPEPTTFELTRPDGEVVVYTPGPKPIPLTSYGAHIHTHSAERKGNHTHWIENANGAANWMHEVPTPIDIPIERGHRHE